MSNFLMMHYHMFVYITFFICFIAWLILFFVKDFWLSFISFLIVFIIGLGFLRIVEIGQNEAEAFHPTGKIITIETNKPIEHLKNNDYEIPYIYNNELKYLKYSGNIKIDNNLKKIQVKLQNLKNYEGQEKNNIVSVITPANLIK